MEMLNSKGIRGLCTILCMILLFCVEAPIAYAAAPGAAEIEVSSHTVEGGDTVKVSFTLSENPGIWGMKFRVGYDHDVMTLKEVTVGSVFAKDEVTLPESLDREQFVFYASGNKIADISSDGRLVSLEFEINSEAVSGKYPVTVSIIQVINVDGEDVDVNVTDGSIAVMDCLHKSTDWKVTEAATCESEGEEADVCNACGETLSTRAIDATGHINTEVKNAVQATEAAEGYTGDTYCKDCGKLISKGSVIPKIDKKCTHTNTAWSTIKAATCEESGLEEESCAVCGAVVSSKTVNAKGHGTVEVIGATVATEAKEGYTGDEYCMDCGKLIKAGSVIPKIEVATSQMTTSATVATTENITTEAVTTENSTTEVTVTENATTENAITKATTMEHVVEDEVQSEKKQSATSVLAGSPVLIALVVALVILVCAAGVVGYMLIKYNNKGRRKSNVKKA